MWRKDGKPIVEEDWKMEEARRNYKGMEAAVAAVMARIGSEKDLSMLQPGLVYAANILFEQFCEYRETLMYETEVEK